MDAEQVQALMARQEELHTRLQATEAAVQAANHRAELAERQLADLRRNPDITVAGAAGTGPKANFLVDTRSLGRPKVFSGKREEWKGWCFSFTAFLGGADPNILQALEWAEQQLDAIPDQPQMGDTEHTLHAPYS